MVYDTYYWIVNIHLNHSKNIRPDDFILNVLMILFWIFPAVLVRIRFREGFPGSSMVIQLKPLRKLLKKSREINIYLITSFKYKSEHAGHVLYVSGPTCDLGGHGRGATRSRPRALACKKLPTGYVPTHAVIIAAFFADCLTTPSGHWSLTFFWLIHLCFTTTVIRILFWHPKSNVLPIYVQ